MKGKTEALERGANLNRLCSDLLRNRSEATQAGTGIISDEPFRIFHTLQKHPAMTTTYINIVCSHRSQLKINQNLRFEVPGTAVGHTPHLPTINAGKQYE